MLRLFWRLLNVTLVDSNIQFGRWKNEHIRQDDERTPNGVEYEKRVLMRNLDKERSLRDLEEFSKIDFDFHNDGLDR